MKKTEAKIKESTATVDGSKVTEKNLDVAEEKCWRGKWQSVLEFTGEISNEGHICNCQGQSIYFSETWILPFTVLFAMGVYTVFAIAFYNNWL